MIGFAFTWMSTMVVWLLLTAGSGGVLGLWSGGELLCGALACLVVSSSCWRLFRGSASWKNLSPRRFAKRLLFSFGPFFAEMAKANFEVALRVITGSIRPGIVQLRAGMKSEAQLVTLANAITLTPGTLSVDLSEAPAGEVPEFIYVHMLAVPDGLEKRGVLEAKEIFGRFDCAAWIREGVS